MSRIAAVLVSFILIAQGQRFRQQPNAYQQQSSYKHDQQTPQYNTDRPPSSVHCPEKNGRFPAGSCDSYIECENGVGQEKLCPDGLLFNAAAGIFSYPCQYPIDVDCRGRAATQPANPTEDCPHQYGYFKLGDPSHCGQFRNCVDGRGYTFDCPEGLAFSEDTYRCDWPDNVASCDAEAYLGFTCPPEPASRTYTDSDYRFFRSPNDCQRYYICISGKPRLYNCGEGSAFNDLINACDGVENVTSCGYSKSAQNPEKMFRH